MVRHSVERALAAARAADPYVVPPARRPQAPLPRPLSTGNLLADCERWCRDHLPPRRRPPETGSGTVVPLKRTRSSGS